MARLAVAGPSSFQAPRREGVALSESSPARIFRVAQLRSVCRSGQSSYPYPELSSNRKRSFNFKPNGLSMHPSVSFEFFPPRNPEMERSLWRTIRRLEDLRPAFVSVTYGALGGVRDRTHETVARLKSQTDLEPAAHLTCLGSSQEEINRVVDGYRRAGVRHIVALRGDPPDEDQHHTGPNGYKHATDLIADLNRLGSFEISVAAHPEGHPESRSLEEDLDVLQRKADAGATRAITQFFFEPSTYLRFRDRALARGITIPIVPGIMPVTNFKRLSKFCEKCGTEMPRWLEKRFENLDADPGLRAMVATATAAELCQTLQREGVNEFHFFTMNKPELTTAVCRLLGVHEQ